MAISPNGTDVYLVYNAYLQPFQTTTASPPQFGNEDIYSGSFPDPTP